LEDQQMKTLLVGGTGMIGGYIALRLREAGADVTLAARSRAPEGSPLADFPLLSGSYIEGDFTVDRLAAFDDLIFTAGNDIRQVPQGATAVESDRFYQRANSVGVPQFFARAKQAGIRRAAYVGSFYPQAKPELVGATGYVRSRLDADVGARALADSDFHVVSLNAPMVTGMLPGTPPIMDKMRAEWALGRLNFPLRATDGGTQFISVHSLYEAVVGGLERGENGRGYLVGDQNFHHADYFKLHFEAAGRRAVFEITDDEMPLMPDMMLYAGRRATIFYEPEGSEALGYTRNDMTRAVEEIVKFVRDHPS
jgi:nucleoside-diphosphate-sugar epimerase